jgi:hypothetical protein
VAPVVKYRAEKPGATYPQDEIAKKSTETIYVWLDLRSALVKRQAPFKNSQLYEEISYVTVDVYENGTPPGSESTMFDQSKNLLIDGFFGCQLKAGTDGDDVSLYITVYTTLNRVLQYRAAVLVRDVDEEG